MGRGPYVVCLHGWGGSTQSFLGLAKELSSYYTFVLVDFNGFGSSPEPDYPYSVDDYVHSVLEIVRKYKMESFSLVCHSFGGRVGIKLCYKYGYLVDKLILVDSAGMKPRRSLLYYFHLLRHKLLTALRIPHTAGSRDYRVLSPIMKKTFVKIVTEPLESCAEFIKVPTLLIWGNKDKETPVYMGKRLLRLIGKSQMVLFLGCGHFSYIERHLYFVRVVDAFLSGENDEMDHGDRRARLHGRAICKIPDSFSKR